MSVLCLVPTAQRAARVARRLCDAQGGVLLGARVATLEAAAGLVLAGGERRPVLSPLAERLLCADAARAAPPFSDATEPSGVLRALRACVSELRQAEVGSEDLRRAARGARGSVATRLESLAAVLAAYEGRLEQHDALDAAAALRAAADRLEGSAAAGEELRELDLLVIEGFTWLPPAALDLALALTRRARRAQWRIPYFAARAELSAVAEPLVRRIEALHHVGGRPIDLVLEDVDGDGRAGRLAAALHRVFGAASGAAEADGGRIFLAPGAGEEGEAEVAAAFLSRLLEGGFAPDEVVLIAASRASAERTCRAAEALHLPLNGHPRAPLTVQAPVQAVLAALEAAARPRRSALEAVLASPYLALSRVPARAGYWLDRAGATDERGDPRGALRRRADTLTSPRAAQERSALLRVSDALAEASRELSRIGTPATAREQAARLRGFLARSGLRRHAGRGAPDLARRDLEAIARLEDLADDLVRSLSTIGRGAEVLEAATWRALLATAADHVTLQPPREAAVGVEVSTLGDAPGLSARAAVLVGCARGAFPEAPARDPLLGDAERLAIDAVLRRPALASGATKVARARHAAFAALAAAREVLCVTWSRPGPSGTGRGPAAVVSELAPLAASADDASPGALPPARWSEDGAVRARAEAALQGRLAATDERVASVVARAAVEAERCASVDARTASRFAGAIPRAVRGAFQEILPRQWTPSQLEDHARCPFRFFVGTVLAAREPAAAEPDIDPRDEGSLAHAVLERFYRERIATGRARVLGTPDEVEELSAAARAVFASFEADGRTGDPAVWASRRSAVLQRLEAVLAEEARQRDDAVPTLVEHRFGGEGGAPPLVFTDGAVRVELRGRLDRVDASGDRIVLLDYKDSRSGTRWREKLSRSALGTVNFQVPAYLMAAARALPGRARLEATYLLLRSAERLAPVVLDAGDPFLATDERTCAEARAAGQRPFADAVLSTVATIRDGVLPIASRDCGGCAFGAVCRFQARAEEEP